MTSALEALENNLATNLNSHDNPEVKTFAWLGLLSTLLPILIEQFQNCGDVSLASKRLTTGSFQDRVTAAHLLRKALREADTSMNLIQRAAFMTAAMTEFKDEENNKKIIKESKALAWSFV